METLEALSNTDLILIAGFGVFLFAQGFIVGDRFASLD